MHGENILNSMMLHKSLELRIDTPYYNAPVVLGASSKVQTFS
jgi:hypothetical protein